MKKICLILIAVFCFVSVAYAAYTTAVYKDSGGDRLVVASGGTLLLESGATFTSTDGAIEAPDIGVTEGNIIVGDSGGEGALLDASGTTKILIGNGTTITSAALSSDVTMDNAGAVTIATGAVEDSMIEGLATGAIILGVDGTAANNLKAVLSGDVTMDGTGDVTIASNAVQAVMINDDVAGDAMEQAADGTLRPKVTTDLTYLKSAIALGESLRTNMNAHAADATEHGTSADATNFALTSGAVTSLASLVALITEIQTDYPAHDADAKLAATWLYHDAQYAGSDLASIVAPVTAADCVARLNDIKTKYNVHDADGTAHANGGSSDQEGTAASDDALSIDSATHVQTLRSRVSVANINSGQTLLPAITGKQYRVISCKAIAYGGSVGTVTTIDVLGTYSAGSVKIVALAQANLTQSTVLTDGGTGSAVLADGASYLAMDSGTAITVLKNGGDADTATGVDFIINYVLE